MNVAPKPISPAPVAAKPTAAKAKRRTSWFITVPLAVGTIGYMAFVFFPGMKALADLRAEIQSQRDFIQQTEKLSPVIQATERQIAEAHEFCSTWRKNAPQAEHPSDFLGSLMSVAKSSGTSSNRLMPQPPIEYETLAEIPIQFNVVGSFSSVFEMLRKLESQPQSIWVTELKIEASREDRGRAVAEIKLDVFSGKSKNSN